MSLFRPRLWRRTWPRRPASAFFGALARLPDAQPHAGSAADGSCRASSIGSSRARQDAVAHDGGVAGSGGGHHYGEFVAAQPGNNVGSRTAPRMRSATAIRTLSPAAWPWVSLMDLKASRSTAG